MPYIKKDATIYKVENIGSPTLIPTGEVDKETGEPIMTTEEHPLYAVRETYKTEEFLSNLTYNLDNAKSAMDTAINKYNELVAKIAEIKADITDIALPDAKTESLAVEAVSEEVIK